MRTTLGILVRLLLAKTVDLHSIVSQTEPAPSFYALNLLSAWIDPFFAVIPSPRFPPELVDPLPGAGLLGVPESALLSQGHGV